MKRAALICVAVVCAIQATAQDDEHRPMPPVPKVAPWMTGADLLRKLNKPTENASAEDYIKGVHDATERRDWCYSSRNLKPVVKPRPADMLATIRTALNELSTAQLKRNAADLLRELWQDKWPCPTSAECCYE